MTFISDDGVELIYQRDVGSVARLMLKPHNADASSSRLYSAGLATACSCGSFITAALVSVDGEVIRTWPALCPNCGDPVVIPRRGHLKVLQCPQDPF